jgi:hypothetical protein
MNSVTTAELKEKNPSAKTMLILIRKEKILVSKEHMIHQNLRAFQWVQKLKNCLKQFNDTPQFLQN